MKQILFLLLLFISTNSFAHYVLECKSYDETIYALVNEHGDVLEVQYENYQGFFGGFKKQCGHIFKHSSEGDVIERVIDFSDDLTTAHMSSAYKDTNAMFDLKRFFCTFRL